MVTSMSKDQLTTAKEVQAEDTTEESQNQEVSLEEISEEENNEANNEDYIMFSDPDEIPNPTVLKNLFFEKKYGIFMQQMFTYKLNYFNI